MEMEATLKKNIIAVFFTAVVSTEKRKVDDGYKRLLDRVSNKINHWHRDR